MSDPRHKWRKDAMSDRRLSASAFRLACALAEYFNAETLRCWPSQQTLADAAGGMDVRTIRRLTDELVQAGYLGIEENDGGRGRSKTYVYVMVKKRTPAPLFEDGKADTSAPFQGRKKRTSMVEKADIHGRKSGHPWSKKGAVVSDKPLKEEPLQEPRQQTSSRAHSREAVVEEKKGRKLAGSLTEEEKVKREPKPGAQPEAVQQPVTGSSLGQGQAKKSRVKTLQQLEEEERKEADEQRRLYQAACDDTQRVLRVLVDRKGLVLPDMEFLKARGIIVNLITNRLAEFGDIVDCLMADVPGSALERLVAFSQSRWEMKWRTDGGEDAHA